MGLSGLTRGKVHYDHGGALLIMYVAWEVIADVSQMSGPGAVLVWPEYLGLPVSQPISHSIRWPLGHDLSYLVPHISDDGLPDMEFISLGHGKCKLPIAFEQNEYPLKQSKLNNCTRASLSDPWCQYMVPKILSWWMGQVMLDWRISVWCSGAYLVMIMIFSLLILLLL
jgi:hypothetical protein